ncbi:ankyrin and armadillo repeat-containing protein-like [Tubulanus polymorphus]|uniref:ankyrin and armadillo repeat-containing protein-like n=1 Tax=Tubulanus polymorphus TaxID=672921 RepID=UPI003DA2A5F1
MNELDENGWAHIHHAAFRGFIKSIERFAVASEEQLELETGDDLKSTPILLAIMSGNIDTIKCLVGLGAKVNTVNSQNHGIVELSALKECLPVLEYFIRLNHEKLSVWKKLIAFFTSDSDEESECAGRCVNALTQVDSSGTINPYWEAAYNNGILPAITRILKSSIGNDTKVQAMLVLDNLLSKEEVQKQFCSSGGMQALVKQIKEPNAHLVELTAKAMRLLGLVESHANLAAQNGAIPALVKVIHTFKEPEVLIEAIDALGNIVDGKEVHQGTAGNTSGCITGLVGLFEDNVNRDLLNSVTVTIRKLAENHSRNQLAFVEEGLAPHVIMLTRVKNRDLQLRSVEAIHVIVMGNTDTQRLFLESGAVMPLMQLLKKSRQANLREKTASAVWALAGCDPEEQRNMADMMGVQLLIEFLGSMSEELHMIGSEGLGVLANGPDSRQTAIANANGVHPLVLLLRSDKEHIVLSVIRTLRHLCVGVGYVPNFKNQTTVSHSRGIKFLVALMVHSRNELIQVEAALTLGYVALGNPDNLEEIQKTLDFSYVRILKMMYCRDATVRLLAGGALAAFAYNNIGQQKEITEQGGVRYNCFIPFLESSDEFFQCYGAFQVVILARIIPDEEQAISSAQGIKTLVDILTNSQNNEILALAADCIARLAHTRAGVPSAIVSIDTVRILCSLCSETESDQVRGNCAIALGYLSYEHIAERQLLSRCRLDPYLMKVLKIFASKRKLATAFVEGWKHYKKVGLPPIGEGRPTLTARKSIQYVKETGRPLTIMSLAEGTLRRSPTDLMHSGGQDEQRHQQQQQAGIPSRMSQTSPMTSHSQSTTLQRSHRSRPTSISQEL